MAGRIVLFAPTSCTGDLTARTLVDRGARAGAGRSLTGAARETRRGGSALLTAFGYDWVPGNLAGALALCEIGASVRPLLRANNESVAGECSCHLSAVGPDYRCGDVPVGAGRAGSAAIPRGRGYHPAP